MSAMDVLPSLPLQVEAGGATVEITPLKVGELPAFLRAVQPVAGRLAGDIDWITLFADEGEAVLDLIALACRRPKDWVAGLAIDEAIRLADAAIEVNADFFIRRVAPEFARVAQHLATRIAGLSLSPDLSAPDTATPTS